MNNIATTLFPALILLSSPAMDSVSCGQRNTSSPTSASPTTTVFLVRHAEKHAESPDPDLTPNGMQRATQLANFLRSIDIAACYSSQFNRTKQTATPTAELHRVTVRVHPAGQELSLVKRITTEHQGRSVLVVGHSNTVPAMLRHLGYRQKVSIGEQNYDDLFVVQFREGEPQIMHLHYGRPTITKQRNHRMKTLK